MSAKTGRARRLPFDAVWESRRLIVEVDEDQHRRATPFFDHVERLTVSGVHRGEQRQLYDDRKRSAARREGYRVLVIPWEGSRNVAGRDRDADRNSYLRLLAKEGVLRQRLWPQQRDANPEILWVHGVPARRNIIGMRGY